MPILSSHGLFYDFKLFCGEILHDIYICDLNFFHYKDQLLNCFLNKVFQASKHNH